MISFKRVVLFAVVIFLSIVLLENVCAETRGQERRRLRQEKRKTDAELSQGSKKGTLLVNGQMRTYVVHVPAGYTGDHAVPLVMVFHGGGGNGEGAERMSQMSPKADEEGFIAVYPNGTGKLKKLLLTWNTWNCCGTAFKENIDDMAFVRQLVEKLKKEYRIDAKRIYATGLSNGGMMSYRLACEAADIFAAVAPVAGALNTDACHPSHPVSLLIFNGTDDRHVLYKGGASESQVAPRTDKPVSFGVSAWVKNNSCSSTPAHQEFGSIAVDAYTGCRDGSEVVLYTIKGGGHSWPGGLAGIHYGNVDPPTQEISATDLIWDFFMNHPKP